MLCAVSLEGGSGLCLLLQDPGGSWPVPVWFVLSAGLFAARRTLCAWPALLGSRGAGAVTLPSGA